MKKTKIIMAKVLSLTMFASIVGTSLPVQAVHAATLTPKTQIQYSNVKKSALYEDSTFKVSETDNSRTVLDKKTNQTAVLTFTNSKHSEGVFKDINGNIKKYSTDTAGNIYLDNVCVIKVNRSVVKVKKGISLDDYTNPIHFTGKDGYTYYYVTEGSYSTRITGTIASVATSLLGLVPFIGPLYTVIGFIEAAETLGSPDVYVVQDEYCMSDYSHYAYKNYFYADADHGDYLGSDTTYQTMW